MSIVRRFLIILVRHEANRAVGQTFGVDLEARARADRKRVPLIVTTILTYLDNRTYSSYSSLFQSVLILHRLSGS